ncbi:MAG: HprK-related kinase A [Rhodoferax sp.]
MPAMKERLANEGVVLPCGPFHVRITSDLDEVAIGLETLYADFPEPDPRGFVDFEVRVASTSPLRRYVRRQARFVCDGRVPFKPLPARQAFAMLEWGLNWVISSHAHDHLVVHAAAVERGGRALMLVADPGSGKSTLCAALVHQGWRLLSDELALVNLATGLLTPIARPVNLKNRSIDIVRALGPGVQIGPVCTDTAKGDVAHMRPPADSVAALQRPARPWMLVFPHYQEGADLAVRAPGKAHAFAEMVRHSFNFALLAGDGFRSIGRLMDQVRVFDMRYGALEQVLPEIQRLWEMPR